MRSIVMVTGNTHVAHLLDTVHHEMDSVVCSHHVYIFMWSPIIEQLILKRSLPANPHDKFGVAVKLLSDTGPHSVRKIIQRSCGILLHERALLSVILLGEGCKEKA